MTSVGSEARNHQKVCDVYDYFRPEFLDVVTNVLRVTPGLRRRTWEFVSIFLALKQAGMLDGSKYGLGMGVGTERLIYGLAPFVKRALLTDLYQVDSGWVSVRTDDPNAMLRARAPWDIEWSKMNAARMDMRTLDLPNEEVDFAWSTGAFEHIGDDDDFIKHFNEVARVLKPDGIYVLTTAVVFGDDSMRFPHNRLFNPYQLVDLINRSDLQAAPVFDCTVKPHSLNQPMFEDLSELGVNIPRQANPHMISFRRGIITTGNCMVLTKRQPGSKPTEIVGFEESCKELLRYARALVRDVWKDPQQIRVDKTKDRAGTPFMYFGPGSINIEATGSAKAMRIISRSRFADKTITAETNADFADRTGRAIFEAKEDNIYKVEFTGVSYNDVHVWAKRAAVPKKKKIAAKTPDIAVG